MLIIPSINSHFWYSMTYWYYLFQNIIIRFLFFNKWSFSLISLPFPRDLRPVIRTSRFEWMALINVICTGKTRTLTRSYPRRHWWSRLRWRYDINLALSTVYYDYTDNRIITVWHDGSRCRNLPQHQWRENNYHSDNNVFCTFHRLNKCEYYSNIIHYIIIVLNAII